MVRSTFAAAFAALLCLALSQGGLALAAERKSLSRELTGLFVEACVNRYGERQQVDDFMHQKFASNVRSLSEGDIASMLGVKGGLGWLVSLPALKSPVLVEENFLNACSVHLLDVDARAVRAAFRQSLDEVAASQQTTVEKREDRSMPVAGNPGRFLHVRLNLSTGRSLQVTLMEARPANGPNHLIMTAIEPKN
jgi:hypothetical protein